MDKKFVRTPQHEAHKSSGIKWMEDIPIYWGVRKLKYEANIVLGKMLCPENKGNYQFKPYLKSKNIQWLNVDVDSVDEMWFSESEMDIYRLRKNDLILSEGGEVGKTCIWDNELDECYIQNSAHKVTFSHKNDSRFYLYLLFIAGNVGFFESIVNRVSIAHLTRDKLSNIVLVFPPSLEQTAIANFLDQKTTQIDQAIAIKEKQITLLNERKHILIQNAVTRGLNPDAPMRDSGVEWIGEIPEHWEIRRSKHLFTQRTERARPNDIQLSATQAYGVISQEKYEKMIGRRVVKIQFHLDKRKHVEIDDFVISMRSFQGGLERAWDSGCIRSSYIVLFPLENIDADFYGYLFKSKKYIEALQATGNFIRDGQDLNFGNFSLVDLFIPPIDEQNQISTFIDKQAVLTNKAVEKHTEQIEKLKEYKSTLINSAVTGKIKVA